MSSTTAPEAKPAFATSYEETSAYQQDETRDLASKKSGTTRLVESARLGLTLLALLSSITILGTAGDTLMVYNTTTLAGAFGISLWPSSFDLRPTVALVVCGALVTLFSAVSLAASKIPSIQARPLVHNLAAFVFPALSLIAALVGISFFYGVNTSSTVYTLQAWTCQWSSVNMGVKPHWGTLCKESKVALYLMVMLVPVELLVLSSAAVGKLSEKKEFVARERKGSRSPTNS